MDKVIKKRVTKSGDSEIIEYLTQRGNSQSWEFDDLMDSDQDKKMIDTFEVITQNIA